MPWDRLIWFTNRKTKEKLTLTQKEKENEDEEVKKYLKLKKKIVWNKKWEELRRWGKSDGGRSAKVPETAIVNRYVVGEK